jgi:hypothetical protein
MNEKEDELVKILQDTVRDVYKSMTKKFLISEEIAMEKMA